MPIFMFDMNTLNKSVKCGKKDGNYRACIVVPQIDQ